MTPDRIAWITLHADPPFGIGGSDAMFVPVLLLGGLASAALVALATFAFSRRRSRSYLLVTLALCALALKAVLGGLWVIQVLPTDQHHLLEHGMDSAIAVLLVGAIYYARTVSKEGPDAEEIR